MELQKAVQRVFLQLSDVLHQLSDEQYTHRSETLSESTIGQHTRHIIEMFLCLEQGYDSGVVNYEKRKRDIRIETSKEFAEELLHTVSSGLDRPDRPLALEASYNEDKDDLINLPTNYYREVVYNLEHTIHHMALIKVGVRELTDIALPESFGVASSTMKHKKECVQ